jgi:hypothetical protein
MKHHIKKLLRESLLGEEFDGDSLFGYHVTSMSNLDSIKQNGLSIGSRSMQGKGLYGFYDYDHAFRYARKGEVNDPIIIKFYITSVDRFLYLNMDIAKSVLGNDYHLETQVENYFYGGFAAFFEEVKKANPSMTEDKLRGILKNIEDNNSEGNQRTFVFSLIPADLNNKLNIVWDGNYGLEFRISNTRYVKVVGYDVPSFHGEDKKEVKFSIFDSIPDDSKYDLLRGFFQANPKIEDFAGAYKLANEMYYGARNNNDFEYYDTIISLLDTLK